MYITICKGYADLVCLLVDHGANVNMNYGESRFLVNKCTCNWNFSIYFSLSCSSFYIIIKKVLQAAIYYVKDLMAFKKIVDKLTSAGISLSKSDPIPLINICLQYSKVGFAKYLLSIGSPINQFENCYLSVIYRCIFLFNNR